MRKWTCGAVASGDEYRFRAIEVVVLEKQVDVLRKTLYMAVEPIGDRAADQEGDLCAAEAQERVTKEDVAAAVSLQEILGNVPAVVFATERLVHEGPLSELERTNSGAAVSDVTETVKS